MAEPVDFAPLYDAWNRGRPEKFSEFLAEDAVYETSGLFPGFETTYHGPEGMLRFYETMLEAWESFEIEVLEALDEGDATIARVRFQGRGRTSGVEVDLEFAHGFSFRDGKIVRFVSRRSVDEARERIAELRESGAWPG